jgi:phosphotriesterase-related protein
LTTNQNQAEVKTTGSGLVTVQEILPPEQAGLIDAHNHLWIKPPPGVQDVPALDNPSVIKQELTSYRIAGGRTILDCQPYGCGRDGKQLHQLSDRTGVNIIACTGYHLEKYYPDDFWLFKASAAEANNLFTSELQEGIKEAPFVRAGFIKVSFEDTVENSPARLLEAATQTVKKVGCAIAAHTQAGKDAEKIIRKLITLGVKPNKIILFHIDKRPDLGLHQALAQEGVLLEYDSFFRPKYHPEENVWPLLEKMINAGYQNRIALGLDFADPAQWESYGGGPGLAALPNILLPRLIELGLPSDTISLITGNNIAERLAINLVKG